ncbi:trypsin-7-like [Diabrotica virgifera virgifera]|uniref:Peptidase S1 domain-containing protein n=1 Tax=Diabrotica virgifera virgifera TaxID=50390 RepID=A0ABM5L8C2_DIAVI|nr:trypsin-7-like [Diabrotica virgifera virgifera]
MVTAFQKGLNTTGPNIKGLAKKVTFSKKIQPIQLPEQDYEVPAGTKVTTAGWGKTEHRVNYTPFLLEISTKIIDSQTCEKLFSSTKGVKVTERNICAENFKEKKVACGGDSGGPLELNGTLIGVVSWGDCNSPAEVVEKYTTVFSDVRDFIPWIKKHAAI